MKIIECGGVWTGGESQPLGPTRIYLAEDCIEELEPAPEIKSDLFVIPSFVDAHCHFIWTGLETVLLDLGEVRDRGGFLSTIRDASAAGSGDDILRGFGFDESTWSETRLPTLDELDAVTGQRPAVIRRICGHCALVNSAMMKLMPADSPGLERETGIIREGVIFDMEKLFPPTAQLFSQALKNAVSLAHAQGVTAVYTFENYQTSQVLSSGSLKLRTSMCLYGRDVLKDPRGSVIKRASGLKFFLDGSIGAGTAAMSCNYSDGSSFDPLLTDDELMEALELAESLKLIPVFHAIGGRALEQLDRVSHAFLASRGGVFEQGIRVEHAEEIGSAWPGHWNQDNHSFVMQPNFVSRWQHEGGLYEERLGRTGSIGLSPFRTVIDAGFRVAFGSDGMPFGPLGGISGATEHPDPDQSISIHKALKAYTIEAASVCGFRQLSGSLRPDRKADLAVLSASPFETHWSNIEVIGTIFDGIPVYEKHRVLEEL